jgi:hypothetical protein
MRGAWACPDIGGDRPPGLGLPIPGSKEEFPDCPAAYLRTADEVAELRVMRGGEPFAEHLVDGAVHPINIVAPVAFDVESGALASGACSPKMLALVRIFLSEKASREAHAAEKRREKRGDRT